MEQLGHKRYDDGIKYVIDEKKCTKCKIMKPITEFWKDKSRGDGLNYHCNDCQMDKERVNPELTKEKKRIKHQVRRERDKNSRYKKQYGITLDQYKVMHVLQNNKCGICLKESAMLYVDHNHTTGKVRELLCNKCNTALGFINEDEAVALRMSDYLKKWK